MANIIFLTPDQTSANLVDFSEHIEFAESIDLKNIKQSHKWSYRKPMCPECSTKLLLSSVPILINGNVKFYLKTCPCCKIMLIVAWDAYNSIASIKYPTSCKYDIDGSEIDEEE